MAETTIEWTRGPRGELGYTFNAWIGCTKVSPGCDNCYAAAQDKFRNWTPEGWGGPRRRTSEANWKLPERWNAAAAAAGERRRVFCSSLADVFDNQVDPQWRLDLYDLIRATPNLDWLLLTKRIGNANAWGLPVTPDGQPLPNVWLGATVVNQEEADRDIPKLLATPARVRFLSMEPMLGPVTLRDWWLAAPKECEGCDGDGLGGRSLHWCPRGACPHDGDVPRLDWVIVGGESGHGARPMHPDWARSLRDQCAAAGVPFLFKQWGEWSPGYGEHGNDMGYDAIVDAKQHGWPEGHCSFRVGKKAAGRLLDGVTHDGFPEVRS